MMKGRRLGQAQGIARREAQTSEQARELADLLNSLVTDRYLG